MGVTHGIIPGMTAEKLLKMLRADGYEILSTRMLGRLILAIMYIHGPHVPFYVKVEGAHIRYRPYQKTVQYCKTCGDLGHRQDICPQPKPNFCYKFCQANQPAEHQCNPICKICNLPHETAGKDCKKKLKPVPPPLYVRTQRYKQQQQMSPLSWSIYSN
ncbi:hypothetical protein HPB49_003164 [Dermacentor silvarum]|uniref:Uncharacterized protein n=1 Tax=Dermacentor silvarum TaxID=543639 RepID=A0ACB8DTA7_DERSI|nr:hypothetical protein HPB49_003164 [Dermacentor silvarum]